MHITYVGPIELDYCVEGCKGVWFDNGELIKVRDFLTHHYYVDTDIKGEYVPKPLQDARIEAERFCPHCYLPMARYNWSLNSNILVDICHTCYGVFLDYGEFEGINEHEKEFMNELKNYVPRAFNKEETQAEKDAIKELIQEINDIKISCKDKGSVCSLFEGLVSVGNSILH